MAGGNPRRRLRDVNARFRARYQPPGAGSRGQPAPGLQAVSSPTLLAVADIDDFERIDIRVGRIVAVEDFPEARKPAWKLRVDFGPEVGVKRTAAQVTNYSREELEDRLVLGVVNFPPRQIGPVRSEVLVLGAPGAEGRVILLQPSSEVPLGGRMF